MFAYNNGRYTLFRMSYDYYQGATQLENETSKFFYCLQFNSTLKLSFDISLFKKELHDYLYPAVCFSRNGTTGLLAMQSFSNYLTHQFSLLAPIELRTTAFLKEHKAFMGKRLLYYDAEWLFKTRLHHFEIISENCESSY